LLKTIANRRVRRLNSAVLKKIRQELLSTFPSFAWLAVFVLVPTLLVLTFAFRQTDPAGGIGDEWTLGQFRIFSEKSIHLLLWRTLWISAVTTVICVVFSLPVAWFIAQVRKEWRPRLLLLVIVPFWTNFLIRVFAWNQILHSEGLLARTFRALHLLGENESLLFNSGAVLVVSV
jgi:ABC-type spermidine/putrescine transport system permease subunit I